MATSGIAAASSVEGLESDVQAHQPVFRSLADAPDRRRRVFVTSSGLCRAESARRELRGLRHSLCRLGLALRRDFPDGAVMFHLDLAVATPPDDGVAQTPQGLIHGTPPWSPPLFASPSGG